MAESSPSPPIDVQVLMREIRGRIRGENLSNEWVRRARRLVPGHLGSTIGRLRASTALLRSAVARIGEPPPSPPTLRGRLGSSFVSVLRRVLFWYTPTIQNADNQIIDALETHLKVTEEILAVLERTNMDIARLSETARREANGA